MSYFSYTNTITNGISADGGNLMTNFNDVRSSLIDGTKDVNVAALACTTLTPSGNVTVSNQTASTVATFNASKVLTSSAVTLTELLLLSGLTSLKNITNLAATAWTPTGSWSTNTTYTGTYRREGDMGYFTVKIALAGAPTAANLTVNLPGSHTIDTAKLPGYDSTFKEVGLASFFDTSASAGYTGMACYNSTTSVKVMINAQAIHAGTVFTRLLACDNASPVTFASGDMVTLTFKVPIVEYA